MLAKVILDIQRWIFFYNLCFSMSSAWWQAFSQQWNLWFLMQHRMIFKKTHVLPAVPALAWEPVGRSHTSAAVLASRPLSPARGFSSCLSAGLPAAILVYKHMACWELQPGTETRSDWKQWPFLLALKLHAQQLNHMQVSAWKSLVKNQYCLPSVLCPQREAKSSNGACTQRDAC